MFPINNSDLFVGNMIICYFCRKISTMEIIGRKREIAELESLYSSNRPEFVVVYGRRRVGKTYLINELFRNRFAFTHTALSPLETDGKEMLRMQLRHFTHSLIRNGADISSEPSNWLEAFYMLETFLEGKADGQKQVVFIDELPWLDTPRSGFVTAFEAFWNSWAAKREDMMLIVCGSAVSWISDKMLGNKGGLYNRTTSEIKLQQFTLHECEMFFKSRQIVLDRYDIVQSYMIFGGVPYYLGLYANGYSLAQNVDRLVFSRKGKLSDEFERLFASIFTNPEDAIKVIKVLSEKRIGYTREELLKKTGIKDGGGFTKLLKSLQESDFIGKFRYFGEKEKHSRYRLIDSFCLFYLYFLYKKSTNDIEFWQHNQNSASVNSWRGFAFENVCFDHIWQIKFALGISGVHTETFSWKGKDSQIDILIDRDDRIINICECKYSSREYEIDKDYDKKLRERMASFIEETKTRKSSMMTFITIYGLKKNEYSGRIQNVITSEDLFR